MTFKRSGDFYNATGNDAEIVSRELGVVLQDRDTFPTCGIPAHRFESAIRELTDAGYSIHILSSGD